MAAVLVDEFQNNDGDAVVAYLKETIKPRARAISVDYARHGSIVSFTICHKNGKVTKRSYDGIPSNAEVSHYLKQRGRIVILMIYHQF